MFASDLNTIGIGLSLKVGDTLFNHKRASNFVVVGFIGDRVYFLIQSLFEKLALNK
jgi:hypothetical protein